MSDAAPHDPMLPACELFADPADVVAWWAEQARERFALRSVEARIAWWVEQARRPTVEAHRLAS